MNAHRYTLHVEHDDLEPTTFQVTVWYERQDTGGLGGWLHWPTA